MLCMKRTADDNGQQAIVIPRSIVDYIMYRLFDCTPLELCPAQKSAPRKLSSYFAVTRTACFGNAGRRTNISCLTYPSREAVCSYVTVDVSLRATITSTDPPYWCGLHGRRQRQTADRPASHSSAQRSGSEPRVALAHARRTSQHGLAICVKSDAPNLKAVYTRLAGGHSAFTCSRSYAGGGKGLRLRLNTGLGRSDAWVAQTARRARQA